MNALTSLKQWGSARGGAASQIINHAFESGEREGQAHSHGRIHAREKSSIMQLIKLSSQGEHRCYTTIRIAPGQCTP
jgi:hypothetical protein